MTAKRAKTDKLKDALFFIILAILTIALLWIIGPYSGAILWSLIAAILFAPLQNRLRDRMGNRTLAALVTLTALTLLIIIPTLLLIAAMVNEASSLYAGIRQGQIDPARWFEQVYSVLPGWATAMLQRFGLTDFDAATRMIQTGFTQSFRTIANQALILSQGAFGMVLGLGMMLYITFFLMRDGETLFAKASGTLPIHAVHRDTLADQFVTVVRATVKGTIVVAIVQGSLGGLIFWLLGIEGALLWAVLMGVLSLVPALGSAIVWVPVAIYLLATGQLWQAAVLTGFGAGVISLVDNLLRPILVGRDARLPDFVVLVTTLGGLEVVGVNGFVLGPLIAALFMSAWSLTSVAPIGAAEPAS